MLFGFGNWKMQSDKNKRREEETDEDKKDKEEKERKSSIRIQSSASIDKNVEVTVIPAARIHFSENITFAPQSKEGSNLVIRTRSFDHPQSRQARSFRQ